MADPGSVVAGFEQVNRAWGGVDIVVINAGLAHVSPLETIDFEKFRDLERVNTDGTLLLLREAAKNMNLQGTGGDIVLISTKNVFAPGADFGAYSATKAAAHQLARVASQEFASHDIRVNMVAPDAVFFTWGTILRAMGGGWAGPHAITGTRPSGTRSVLP